MESNAWGLLAHLLEQEKAVNLRREKVKNLNCLVLAQKISDIGRVGADSAKNHSKDIDVIAFREGITNKVRHTGYSQITFRKAGKLRALNLNCNVVVLNMNWKLIESTLRMYPNHQGLRNIALLMKCPQLRL